MGGSRRKGLLLIVSLFLMIKPYSCMDEDYTCNRRPLATKTDALPADNRFALDIVGCNDNYIPERQYPIKLYAKDGVSTFIAFTIWAQGDEKPNEKNPHNPIILEHGQVTSSPNSSIQDTVSKDNCPDTVFHSHVQPKTSVEALWVAPRKGNQCVTIFAYVAVKPDVWYNSDGPLNKKVCEDHRKEEDMKPPENSNCQVCEEARYQLNFEGMWSYNTHPKMFPKLQETAKFSDIVGASHDLNFVLYKDNSEASHGLKMLAEQGNTTEIEQEILKHLGTNVRTVIKATGPYRPSLSTVATFRASSKHHFISLVTAIIPSPDWFLGVYNLELCDNKTGNWATYFRYNMYPMDAGTDSGSGFDSPNEETSPPQVIMKADITKEVPYNQIRPFAKLSVSLIRTYANPECIQHASETKPDEDYGGGDGDDNTPSERTVTTSTSTTPPPPEEDPHSKGECPLTTWEEWLPCEGMCADDQPADGYHSRFRYPIVDGVAIGKYFNKEEENKEIPEACLEEATSETEKCKVDCTPTTEENPEIEAEGRVWDHVKPGRHWGR